MLKTLEKNLNLHKIDYKYFDTSDEVKEYLRNEINGEKIAFGGSMTLKELGLYDILRENNEVFWHWETKTPEQRKIESELTVYMLSANAIAATGEIVNIDGTGNRVANAIYGPQKVYYVIGENKITPDLMSAIDRARNMAAPPNAKRLGLNTPCAIDGKCHNCASENRICNAMSIIMARTTKQQKCEVIIIGEKLGY